MGRTPKSPAEATLPTLLPRGQTKAGCATACAACWLVPVGEGRLLPAVMVPPGAGWCRLGGAGPLTAGLLSGWLLGWSLSLVVRLGGLALADWLAGSSLWVCPGAGWPEIRRMPTLCGCPLPCWAATERTMPYSSERALPPRGLLL